MRLESRLLVLAASLLAVAACDGALTTTVAGDGGVEDLLTGRATRNTSVDGGPIGIAVSPQANPSGRNFVAHLTGAEEVPPNDTRATGQAIFQLSADGSELRYRLIVANIENVTQAHIHVAPAGQNGPVTAWLYPSAPPAQLIPGRSSGVLATGVIMTGNLVGPLAGQELNDLVELMRAGDTYVNVHTSQYPPGEVRGQIRGIGP